MGCSPISCHGNFARWHESYGALCLDDAPLSVVLPLAVAADALAGDAGAAVDHFANSASTTARRGGKANFTVSQT